MDKLTGSGEASPPSLSSSSSSSSAGCATGNQSPDYLYRTIVPGVYSEEQQVGKSVCTNFARHGKFRNLNLLRKKLLNEIKTRTYQHFWVATYNILANTWLCPERYSYVDGALREPNRRAHCIVKEIQTARLSVKSQLHLVAIQELDANLEDYFARKMAKYGFSEHLFLANQEGEGVAMFVDTTRFEILDSKAVFFNQLAKDECKVICAQAHETAAQELDPPSTDAEINKRAREIAKKNYFYRIYQEIEEISHHSTLICMILKDRKNNRPFAAATSHFYWGMGTAINLKRKQLAQVMMTMNLLDKMREPFRTDEEDVPVILMGDFNSKPGGPIWKLLTEGKLIGSECEILTPNEYEREALHSDHPDHVSISTIFHSSYDCHSNERASDAPKSLLLEQNRPTHYGLNFQGCIDYIFHDRIQFITTRYLRQLDECWYKKYKALPNKWCPSDHILLAAEIEWNPIKPDSCDEHSLMVALRSSARHYDETDSGNESA